MLNIELLHFVILAICGYSETCIRRSPLGPDQLVVIHRWPAYGVCTKIDYNTLFNGETAQVTIIWLQ